MPEITAAIVKALRERTGLPMMDCKKALEETGGDQAAAEDICASRAARPRKRGSAAKPRPAGSPSMPTSKEAPARWSN